MKPLKKITISSSSDIEDIFNEKVGEWLENNCNPVKEYHGYEYRDGDINKAKEAVRGELIETINQL